MAVAEPLTATRHYVPSQANQALAARRGFALPMDANSTQPFHDDLREMIFSFVPRQEVIPRDSTEVGHADEIDLFIEGLQRLSSPADIQKGRVAVFKHADRLFRADDFKQFNLMLLRINVEAFPVELLLTITRCAALASKDLPAKDAFYNRVKRRFERDLGRLRADKLLSRLK